MLKIAAITIGIVVALALLAIATIVVWIYIQQAEGKNPFQ